MLLVAVLAFLGFAAVRDFQRQNLPTPTFPSLAEAPDASLHGTVAFISEAKHVDDPVRQACARVALASGAFAFSTGAVIGVDGGRSTLRTRG